MLHAGAPAPSRQTIRVSTNSKFASSSNSHFPPIRVPPPILSILARQFLRGHTCAIPTYLVHVGPARQTVLSFFELSTVPANSLSLTPTRFYSGARTPFANQFIMPGAQFLHKTQFALLSICNSPCSPPILSWRASSCRDTIHVCSNSFLRISSSKKQFAFPPIPIRCRRTNTRKRTCKRSHDDDEMKMKRILGIPTQEALGGAPKRGLEVQHAGPKPQIKHDTPYYETIRRYTARAK